MSERKVIERDGNGRIKARRWARIEGRRAEVLDCHNYARGAASLVGWDRMQEPNFLRFERELEEAAIALKEQKAAEARGKPMTVKAKASVSVTSPKTSILPVLKITVPQAGPLRSPVTVTSEKPEPRRLVPLPKAMTMAGE